MGSAPTTADPSGSAGLIGGQGKMGGENVFSELKNWWDTPAKAEGGLIVDRDHYDTGGDVDPYEATNDPMKDVLKSQEASKHNALATAKGNGPGGAGGPQSGLGQLTQGLGAAKGLYSMGSDVAGGLGSLGAGFSSAGNAAALDSALGPGFFAGNIGLGAEGASAAGTGLMGSIGSGLGSLFAEAGPLAFLGLASGGTADRQHFAGDDGNSGAVLPVDTETVDTQPGLLPADLAAEAVQPTGEGAKQKGLAVAAQPERPSEDERLAPTLGALRRIESGGDYGVVGPASRKGDKPYGAYQIMGANIPSWTQAALGRAMTPEEFLANPDAQDATAKHRAGLYLKQYDDPRQVASMWLSGRPIEKAGDSADVLGTTVPKYVSMFDRYYGGQDLAPGDQRRAGPTPPGLVGAGMQAAPSDGSSLYDKPTSSSFLVPALGFLGSMLASQRPTLGGALGEGLLGGTGAYMAQQKQDAQLRAMEPQIAQRNVEALTALSSGLKQYNAMNGTNLTIQQFSKLTPGEISKYAGPAAAAAVTGSQTGAQPYSYEPSEMASLVIHHPGGVDIPASADPGYLNAYKAHYASFGDNAYAKQQIDFANKNIDQAKTSTLSSAGEVIPTPGAISTGQQGLSGQQRVAASSDFEQKGRDFRTQSVEIENHLDQLSDALKNFRTGADAASRANLDRVMDAIDPDHKFASLHGNDGSNYDKVIKSAVAIQIAQLQGLSARAPASELNALQKVIPGPDLTPDAVRQIVVNAKAHNEYQRKMYDEYDPEKYGYNSSAYQKDFFAKNNYQDFINNAMESTAPGAGTSGARSAGKTVTRSGTVTQGPNAGKKVVEYSDGTREYQ